MMEQPPPSVTKPAVPSESTVATLLRERIDHGVAVGLAAGVVDPAVSVTAMAGFAEIATRPVAAETVFEIGSLGKLFTATVLAVLADEGLVAIDEPVSALLPPGVEAPQCGRDMTLLDLATHTSGLPRLPTNLELDSSMSLGRYTVDALYEFLNGYELPREVGSEYEYSNLGYGLLGHVLALRARRTFPDLVADCVLRPLGMGSTTYDLSIVPADLRAVPHDERLRPVPLWENPALPGAGGPLSTLPDMLRFVRANLPGTDSSLARAIARTHAPCTVISPHMSVGIGWHLRQLPDGELLFHSGETGGSRAAIVLDPASSGGAVVLSNSMHRIEDIAFHLVNDQLALDPPDVDPGLALPRDVLERYAGTYALKGGGTVTVTLDDSGLTATATGLGGAPLHARTETEFFVTVIPVAVTFIPAPDGTTAGLILHNLGRDVSGHKVQ